jgi:uncharacterized membrane protein YhiD involved in acid resistance
MNLDQLLSYFEATQPINPTEIIAQAALLYILAKALSLLYIYTGNSLSNRSRLATIFPLMALTTMLIISVVKSSLALSLGLVGALSIVRFRAAIKDPEELAFIFLSISLGLGFGADQVVLTTVFFVAIAAILLARLLFRGRLGRRFTEADSAHLELIFEKQQQLPKINEILDQHCQEVKLTRLDQNEHQAMRFLVKPKSVESLDRLQQEFLSLDADVQLTVLQYQPLI